MRFLDTDGIIPGVTRNGFRLVVFSAVIMVIVLFFRRGIMGDKEFSTERIAGFFAARKKKKEATK